MRDNRAAGGQPLAHGTDSCEDQVHFSLAVAWRARHSRCHSCENGKSGSPSRAILDAREPAPAVIPVKTGKAWGGHDEAGKNRHHQTEIRPEVPGD